MKATYTMTGKILVIFISLGMLLHLNSYANGNDKSEAINTSYENAIEIDNEVEVEEWMMNLDLWTGNPSDVDVVEEEMNIEGWMINAGENHWDISSSEEINEPEIEVENWMTDLSKW
jgi:hypothetical protein